MAGDIRKQQDIRACLQRARSKPNPIMGGALDQDVHIVGEVEAWRDREVEDAVAGQMSRLRDEYAANMGAECSRAAERAVIEERTRLRQILMLRAKTISLSANPPSLADFIEEIERDWLSLK
jgi:hypothetical protein